MELLTTEDVLQRVPCWTRITLYRKYAKGEFPRPARLGGRLAWKAAEVDAWIAARFSEGHEKAAA